MRPLFLTTSCVLILGLCAYLGSQSPPSTVQVRVRLVDVHTGKETAGLVRVLRIDKEEKPIPLPGLLDRMEGTGAGYQQLGWHVVPAAGAQLTLPRTALRLEALSGLETILVKQDLDLGERVPEEISVVLPTLFRPEERSLVAGNTHLHLRGSSLDRADDYLRNVPLADRLKVVFTSHLERNKDDRFYISNRYAVGDLKRFQATGILFNHGEEHRHNFEAFGQGYGHVMFLDIKNLVRPVSLGPGITGKGNDDRPLRPGLDDARGQKGTVLWCHNTNGYEDVPSILAGRVDALNVFDGSRTGRFEDGYYRYLNIGLRLPISTGTDWFIYDFARVYAEVKEKLTIASWLSALKAGRNQVTNGPLLDLTVNGQPVGSIVKLDEPDTVRIEGRARGRQDFGKLQLIHNGRVIQEARARGSGMYYQASLARAARIDRPGWLCLRIDSNTRNEMGRVLFAHTSPIYLDYQGQGPFDLDSAQALLRQLEEGQANISKRGVFSSNQARARVLALYDQAARNLRKRINRRGE
jgi:hypothetical protein